MKLITQEWEGNAVAFRTADGYASLTHLCMPFDKRPNDFLTLPSTKAFIDALAGIENKLPENLVITQRGRPAKDGPLNPLEWALGPDSPAQQNKGEKIPQLNSGTWAHPDLALECARWLDPAFAIWCNRVIRGILNGEIGVDPAELPEVPVNLEDEDEEDEEPLTEIDVPRSDVLNWGMADWPQEFVIALGKRVKSLALAFGVPAKRIPHHGYGALYAWPDELFSFAMQEMHRDPRWDHVFGRSRPRRSKYSKERRRR